jgi:hypothetical protein
MPVCWCTHIAYERNTHSGIKTSRPLTFEGIAASMESIYECSTWEPVFL